MIISRDYRGDVDTGIADKFMALLLEKEDEGQLTPILNYDDTYLLYVKHQNVYVVAATRKNANAMLIFVYLHKLVQVFTEYFKELEEESIRDNFVIIYELFDELMDYGYPQTTEVRE